MIRLFVALDLPGDIRSTLAALPLGEGWRPVRAEGLHVTLAFLGWREESDVAAIAGAVEPVVAPVRPLALGEAVLLPPRRPRVMAVELDDPAGDSVALQASVSAALTAAGLYEPEKRRWLPHVTIGRARSPMPRDAALPRVPLMEFTPPAVTLYRSLMGPGGSRYEPAARFEL